jgi:hypothetical protein
MEFQIKKKRSVAELLSVNLTEHERQFHPHNWRSTEIGRRVVSDPKANYVLHEQANFQTLSAMPNPIMIEKVDDRKLETFIEETSKYIQELKTQVNELTTLYIDRFWVTARRVVDAFILDVNPATESEDHRMAIFLEDSKEKLEKADISLQAALELYVKSHSEGGFKAHN